MRHHVLSVGIGLVMLVVGLGLWQLADGIDTPVIDLSTLGVVLLVLGVVEMLVSGVALAVPSSRRRDDPL